MWLESIATQLLYLLLVVSKNKDAALVETANVEAFISIVSAAP